MGWEILKTDGTTFSLTDDTYTLGFMDFSRTWDLRPARSPHSDVWIAVGTGWEQPTPITLHVTIQAGTYASLLTARDNLVSALDDGVSVRNTNDTTVSRGILDVLSVRLEPLGGRHDARAVVRVVPSLSDYVQVGGGYNPPGSTITFDDGTPFELDDAGTLLMDVEGS